MCFVTSVGLIAGIGERSRDRDVYEGQSCTYLSSRLNPTRRKKAEAAKPKAGAKKILVLEGTLIHGRHGASEHQS